MVAYTFGPVLGGRDTNLCESEASTAYRVRSRIARATKYDPVLIKQTNQIKKEENEKNVREKEVLNTFSHHKHLSCILWFGGFSNIPTQSHREINKQASK